MPAQATGILSRFHGKRIALFRIKKTATYQTMPNVIFSTKCRKWLFLSSFYTTVPNVISFKPELVWCCFGFLLKRFAKMPFLRTTIKQWQKK